MDKVWSYLGQGDQNEAPFVEPGMGYCQVRVLHDQAVIKEDIQINGAGAFGDCPFAAEHIRFDPLQFREEAPRREAGFKAENGIQKVVLGDRAYRFRIIKTGQGGDAGIGNLAGFGDCPEKVQFTIAEIRTEADVCYGIHGEE